MNWIVFVIALWLCLGLDLGVSDAFRIGSWAIAPSFTVVLLAFVGAWAPAHIALGWALVAGLALDLVTTVSRADGGATAIIGPHALGCVAGVYVILTVRSLMFRRNVLALAFLAFMLGLVMTIVLSFMMGIRGALDDAILGAGPARTLVEGALSAVCTGVLGIPFGWTLLTLRPVFSFRDASSSLPLAGSARR